MEKRIEHIEYRIKLLSEIADYESHPFVYTVLEANLTESQVIGIYDLMDQATEIIRGGKELTLSKIEQGIFELVPNQNGNYHFVKDIIGALNEEDRWVEVYNHLKEKGADI
jgi:hypothetical protein